MKKLMMCLCIAGFVLCVNGCFWLLAAAGAGAGTVGYMRGELKATHAESIESMYKAGKLAIEEFEFFILEDTVDKSSAKIIARNAQDKKIQILIKMVNAEMTEIRIRIDNFGDQALSQVIYDKIKVKL